MVAMIANRLTSRCGVFSWNSNAACGCGELVQFAHNLRRQRFGDLREIGILNGNYRPRKQRLNLSSKSRDQIDSLPSGITIPDSPEWSKVLCWECLFRFNLSVTFSRETHASVVKDRKGSCSVTESLYLFSCSVIRSWLLLGAGMSSEGAGSELFYHIHGDPRRRWRANCWSGRQGDVDDLMGEKIGFSKMLLSLFPITEGLHTTGTQPLGTVYSKPVWVWPGSNSRSSGRSPKREPPETVLGSRH